MASSHGNRGRRERERERDMWLSWHFASVRQKPGRPQVQTVSEVGRGEAHATTGRARQVPAARRGSGLLQWLTEDEFRFVHLAAQAYFAASAVGDPAALAEHAEDPWWEPVIMLAAGRLSDARPLVQALVDGGHTALAGLALLFAQHLRGIFPEILPSKDGSGQESRARTSKGLKKLDVNYSTVQLGLGLGISIKTINFRDAGTRRYTKNYTRADGELRAEASDYHERQPYAVLIAVIFLPLDSCDDGGRSAPSSSWLPHHPCYGRSSR